MPRIGRHPLKVTGMPDDFKPERITVATIVHIPTLSNYWAESLNVLRLFFQSLFASTDLPFDLMVFDNGSCTEVQDYLLGLRRDGRIQYLILSEHNLKKLGALNFLLSAAPGEYVAYADSDVYFLPGWLETSLKVLEAFPEAGKVTALPIVGGDVTKITPELYEFAVKDPSIKVETGRIVPDQYIQAHQISIGKDLAIFISAHADRNDAVFTRNGIRAFYSTADFQFTMTRWAVQSVMPLRIENDSEYFDPIYSPILEIRLAQAGIWQLSTPDYLVHHMGNRVPDLRAELPWLENVPEISAAGEPPRLRRNHKRSRHGLLQSTAVRKMLKKVNTLSYRLLYGD